MSVVKLYKVRNQVEASSHFTSRPQIALLATLRSCTAEELNFIMHNIDVAKLVGAVHDKLFQGAKVGANRRRRLFELWTKDRRDDLDTRSKLRIVAGLVQRGKLHKELAVVEKVAESIDRGSLGEDDAKALDELLERARAKDTGSDETKKLVARLDEPGFSLAHGLDELPPSLRTRGEAVIAQLKEGLYKRFPGGPDAAFKSDIIARILGTLGLASLQDVVEPKLHAEFPTARALVDRCVAAQLANPVLVAAAAEGEMRGDKLTRGLFPEGDAAAAQLEEAVHLAAVLHTITKESVYEPVPKKEEGQEEEGKGEGKEEGKGKEEEEEKEKDEGPEPLLVKVMRLLEEEKEGKDYLGATRSLFEAMKMVTIARFSKRASGYKRGKHFDKAGKSTVIRINILEAMYEDVKHGWDDNAECGWFLATHPTTCEPVEGLHNTNRHNFQGLNVPATGAPFPEQWDNMYMSWNLAFCSVFPSWPYYFAKLVCPTVSEYHQHPDMFLFNRAIALHLLICYLLSRRVNKNEVPSTPTWYRRRLTKLWGRVNREVGIQYANRVHRTLVINGNEDDAHDKGIGGGSAVVSSWKVLRPILKSTRAVESFVAKIISGLFGHDADDVDELA